MHLTLRQLRYFVAIVDAANMSRAAARLHVAPTALSLQVRAMEDALGVRLLDRHSRGVRPTESGSDLYARSKAILDLMEETERAIRPAAQFEGKAIRLGMPPAVARVVGVEALLGAATGYHGLKVQISEGWSADLMVKLRAGHLDFVLGYEVTSSKGIVVKDLLEERFVLVGTSSLIGTGRRIGLSRALDKNLIFYGDRSVAWSVALEAATLAGHGPLEKRVVESIDIWRTMLCRGIAAAIAPFGAIAEECRRGDLSARVISNPPLLRRLGLAGSAEATEFGRASGFDAFLSGLVISSHMASGPYYRKLADARRMVS